MTATATPRLLDDDDIADRDRRFPPNRMMCPHCGRLVPAATLVRRHPNGGAPCPGSRQNPRNPWADRRRLWNGNPNPHAAAYATWLAERTGT